MALTYHAGQLEVQSEANSRPAADMLAERLAGRGQRNLDFYASADLLVLATADAAGVLRFMALSGEPPLLSPGEDGQLQLHEGTTDLADGAQAGAIAINLQERRRARANGRVIIREGRAYLDAAEEIINCRKYIAPSVSFDAAFHNGPEAREPVNANEASLLRVLGRVETAFLASVNPEGRPDVSHKGGPAGFLSFDPQTRVLTWPELIGNGMFRAPATCGLREPCPSSRWTSNQATPSSSPDAANTAPRCVTRSLATEAYGLPNSTSRRKA